MAIITTYPDDSAVTDDDKFLVSDSSGATKLASGAIIKDYVLADGNVTTSTLADSAVTADKVDLSSFRLGYADSTTNQGTTSNTDVTGLTSTITVDGTQRIRIEGFINFIINANANGYIRIYEGATLIKAASSYSNGAQTSGNVVAYITPTSGSHTYNIKMQPLTGTMTTNHASIGFSGFIDISVA